MRLDAEKDGAVWAQVNDHRVTRCGRFLRKSRLDEIPQFWNILKGEMSLVGPRPERPEFVSELEKTLPHYHLRHLVKPGLTGWAQIHYPYGASFADSKRKLAFDLYYVIHYGIPLDISILLKTLVSMIKGAR
jgi:lipopolysaccharide/colanic/teichoic acid biosynthesis glycosyltransferase